ncbi:MAG: shikimate kinase [Clostridia bacterium]|nr:shikimate kinase [Clostridia bacterium]
MNIVLCGMPGAGKTVTSLALQAISGKKAVDTDAIIVQKYGRITDIFQNYGEEYFRDLETQTCKDLANSENLIIATGGGCVIRPQNVKYLKKNGKIIYLKAQKETLVKRVSQNNERPLLVGDAEEKIEKLMLARAAIYESVADVVIDTDGLSPQAVAEKILEIIKDN